MTLKNLPPLTESTVNTSEASYVSSNPKDYGSKGQEWNIDFIEYMKSIVTHPVYKGMPDAVGTEGKIQWEAPSNRSSGIYQHTHQKRRQWWQAKAIQAGISPLSDQWISKTAKKIHPTGEKPCKRCGTVLQIAYAYPNKRLLNKIEKKYGGRIEFLPLLKITDLVQQVADLIDAKTAIEDFSQMLKTSHISVPAFDGELDDFLSWIEDVYIPSEPSTLSPGAMSNAPDRFDGFHSFNLCCRGIADSGRSLSNLKSYGTDRRVFEYWSEGNWIAADKLMALISSAFANEANADGGDGAPTADHVGPLSLGFKHTPYFRLLSKRANSAKNNRMTLADIKRLLEIEEKGEIVTSWYAENLWNSRKGDVDTEEKALRISKLLRDNQRNAMIILSELFNGKHYGLLQYLMELNHADSNVQFSNLRIENFETAFDDVILTPRTTKFATEQKARRLRVGYEALRTYLMKLNRHAYIVSNDEVEKEKEKLLEYLKDNAILLSPIDQAIETVIFPTNGIILEEDIRKLINESPEMPIKIYEEAKIKIGKIMYHIASTLSNMWDDDRYIRENFDLD